MSAYECIRVFMSVQGRAQPTMLIILPILLFSSSQKLPITFTFMAITGAFIPQFIFVHPLFL